MTIKIKRIYEEPKKSDGFRILVDRLWPRGVKKDEAELDLWLKDIAPSVSLRKWFDHDPKKFAEFQKRYAKELMGKQELIDVVKKEAKQKTVTLLFGAKNMECNHALVLRDFILSKI